MRFLANSCLGSRFLEGKMDRLPQRKEPARAMR